jgi:PAS domain S-box-containing protein/putative nucleotidyltransferase with HDIG domain
VYCITLSGWVLAGFYYLYDYQEYGSQLYSHFFSHLDVSSVMFHALITTAPLVSTVLGYFVRERISLLEHIGELTERYRDYYDNAPYGYHSVDRNLTIVDVNKSWLEMFGYERDEVIGKMNLIDLSPSHLVEHVRQYHQNLVDKQEFESIEAELRRKDGSFLPVILSDTVISDSEGSFVRSRTIVKDNTERQKYISALQTVADYWKHTFDSMPWGVMMLDARGKVLRSNDFIRGIEGITPDNLSRTHCAQLIAQMSNGGHQPGEEATGMTEFQVPASGRHFRLFGRELTYEGSVMNYVFSLVDMSDVKDGENKLIDSRNAFFNMLKDAHAAYQELDELYNHLILAFANAIDAKSPWTKGHSERVTRLSTALAVEAGLRESEINTLRTAALLHDIGKIGTYDYLLEKRDGLTEGEFDLVKMHPVQSAKILAPISRLRSVIDVVKYHHEHYDGSGYPDNLKGDEIPYMARILTIADSYDSMTADRPYRRAPGREFAMGELKRCAGTHFDPELVELFLRVLEKGMV